MPQYLENVSEKHRNVLKNKLEDELNCIKVKQHDQLEKLVKKYKKCKVMLEEFNLSQKSKVKQYEKKDCFKHFLKKGRSVPKKPKFGRRGVISLLSQSSELNQIKKAAEEILDKEAEK